MSMARSISPKRARLEDFILESLIEDAQDVETYFVWLTPQMAEFLLDRNTKNRPVSDRWVAELCTIISNDEWELNGEAIVVSDTGKLIQGQHRCYAVTMTGKSIPTLIVVGVSESAFATFDRGRKRTAGDVFAIDGEVNARSEAAVCRTAYLHHLTGDPFCNTFGAKPSAKVLLDFLHKNADIRDATHWAVSNHWCKRYLSPSITGFCWYVFMKKNKEAAIAFFDKLEHGAGLEAGSPVLALRERMIDAASSKGKLTPEFKTALVFKAFKLFLRGATVRSLSVRTEGPAAEKDLYVI